MIFLTSKFLIIIVKYWENTNMHENIHLIFQEIEKEMELRNKWTLIWIKYLGFMYQF